MKILQTNASSGFRVLAGTDLSQAASMTLPPGASTGGPDNQHAQSDQWIYVVAGSGTAAVEGEEHKLEAGSLLLIEAGEGHEISVTGNQPLQTISIYAPPEY